MTRGLSALVAAISGLALPIGLAMSSGDGIATLPGWARLGLVAAWFAGPLLAGAILQRRRFPPYLLPGFVWWLASPAGILLLASHCPVSDSVCDGPGMAVGMGIIMAPVAGLLAAFVSWVTGSLLARWTAARRSTPEAGQ